LDIKKWSVEMFSEYTRALVRVGANNAVTNILRILDIEKWTPSIFANAITAYTKIGDMQTAFYLLNILPQDEWNSDVFNSFAVYARKTGNRRDFIFRVERFPVGQWDRLLYSQYVESLFEIREYQKIMDFAATINVHAQSMSFINTVASSMLELGNPRQALDLLNTQNRGAWNDFSRACAIKAEEVLKQTG
jgi:hypothetical protein